jgi:hypothetical protein
VCGVERHLTLADLGGAAKVGRHGDVLLFQAKLRRTLDEQISVKRHLLANQAVDAFVRGFAGTNLCAQIVVVGRLTNLTNWQIGKLANWQLK